MLWVLFTFTWFNAKTSLPHSILVFRYLFIFVNSANDTSWVNIQHCTLARPILITGTMSDSLPNWKREFFYTFMEDSSWANCFRLNFSKAYDGTLRELSLRVDERTTISILTVIACSLFICLSKSHHSRNIS